MVPRWGPKGRTRKGEGLLALATAAGTAAAATAGTAAASTAGTATKEASAAGSAAVNHDCAGLSHRHRLSPNPL